MKETASKKSKGNGGWRGKILQVDLSNSKIWDEELSQDLINN
jgi:aldehyde:ferredoxin oxidoreductase